MDQDAPSVKRLQCLPLIFIATSVSTFFHLSTAFKLFRYNVNLLQAKAVGIKKGVTTGISLGTVFLIMFSTYGLAFWYGSELIFAGEMDLGTMLTTFFSVLIGAFSLGGVSIK